MVKPQFQAWRDPMWISRLVGMPEPRYHRSGESALAGTTVAFAAFRAAQEVLLFYLQHEDREASKRRTEDPTAASLLIARINNLTAF
jgi:hypothetical protein